MFEVTDMVYKVRTAKIENDGTVTEGKRVHIIQWPAELCVGGLYFLNTGRLYRIVETVE